MPPLPDWWEGKEMEILDEKINWEEKEDLFIESMMEIENVRGRQIYENIHDAMKFLSTPYEMSFSVSDILEVHKCILQDVKRSWAGKTRDQCDVPDRVYSRTSDGKVHIFPHAQWIPGVLHHIVDHFNETLLENENLSKLDVVRLSAWVMFKVVDLHPFPDGNGRVCRVLCHHILRHSFPPFVPMMGKQTIKEERIRYIQCLEKCRKDGNTDHLAYLLIHYLWVNNHSPRGSKFTTQPELTNVQSSEVRISK